MKSGVELVPNVPLSDSSPSPQQINGINSMDNSAHGVFVRNATKSYGVGRYRCSVLQGLDMNVKKGTM